jgi:hypothetical protein
MSHELRTPLNAIIGYSDLLLEDAEARGDGEQVADLRKIGVAGVHLLELISNILDLTKIEAGRMELWPERFSARALVQDVTAALETLAEKRGDHIELRDPPRGRVHAHRHAQAAADAVQPDRQRDQVHRARDDPRRRAPPGDRRRATSSRSPSQTRASASHRTRCRGCSPTSRRPTRRRPAATAAPASACRSPASSVGSWAARSA